ncbi:DDE-type integrase/transposase/recombinase, partial [Blastococcus sp. SYSU DS0510]
TARRDRPDPVRRVRGHLLPSQPRPDTRRSVSSEPPLNPARDTLSRATIHRILTWHGAVVPEPAKRPKSSYIRFAAEQPNETWQSDFTHYRLTTGADTEVITWLDDHSRLALHVTAHARITGPIVLATFTNAAAQHGYPASTLTDNGMVYTTRFAGGRGGRNHLETELRRLGITQKNSRPNHPTTCGKVERFQQTLKKWLRAQPAQPATTADLQALLDVFVDAYNAHRPHRSLPQRATPRPPTPPDPKPDPAPIPTPTTGSAPTRSTKPAASPSAWPAACTTSASAEPTPEPTSTCSSRTCTSASSTPPPANCSASSPSTPPATTSAPAEHPASPRKSASPDPRIVGPGYADVLRHHTQRAQPSKRTATIGTVTRSTLVSHGTPHK